jgi:DNA-binding Xre family transcriptional regulator
MSYPERNGQSDREHIHRNLTLLQYYQNQNLCRMLNNETRMIRYENIETLCRLLECTPNDLFEIIDDEPEN